MKTLWVPYNTDRDGEVYFFNKEGGTSTCFDTLDSLSFDTGSDVEFFITQKYKESILPKSEQRFYFFRLYTHVEDHE